MTSQTEIMTSQPLFLNTFSLRSPRVAIFADIIKIVTILLKNLSRLKKVKRLRNNVSKYNLYLYFLI